jgi:hypothetical protein
MPATHYLVTSRAKSSESPTAPGTLHEAPKKQPLTNNLNHDLCSVVWRSCKASGRSNPVSTAQIRAPTTSRFHINKGRGFEEP